jgi:hypothetical protein
MPTVRTIVAIVDAGVRSMPAAVRRSQRSAMSTHDLSEACKTYNPQRYVRAAHRMVRIERSAE